MMLQSKILKLNFRQATPEKEVQSEAQKNDPLASILVEESKSITQKSNRLEGLNLKSAPYMPKVKEGYYKQHTHTKWVDQADVFTFENFFNPDHSKLVDFTKQRIEKGAKQGRYNFPKPNYLLAAPKNTYCSWEQYPDNLEEIVRKESPRIIDQAYPGT